MFYGGLRPFCTLPGGPVIALSSRTKPTAEFAINKGNESQPQHRGWQGKPSLATPSLAVVWVGTREGTPRGRPLAYNGSQMPKAEL